MASVDGGSTARVQLTRYGLDGSGPGQLVTQSFTAKAIGAALLLDFGATGLGGKPGQLDGDG